MIKRNVIYILICVVFILLGILYNQNSKSRVLESLAELPYDEYEKFQMWRLNELVDNYAYGKVKFEDCLYFTMQLPTYMKAKGYSDNEIDALNNKLYNLFSSKESFEKAESFALEKAYENAVDQYAKVIPDDKENYDLAQVRINEILTKSYIVEAEKLARSYYYDRAINLLTMAKESLENTQILDEKIREYEDKKNELVLYDGSVYHIFFHSLIVDTDLAFDGDSMTKGYNYWMLTVDEFKKILQYLYDRDYIIIDIYSLFEEVEDKTNNSKKIVPKHIYIPKDKKPIILSIDDLNYYEYMGNDGFADRLVLDEDGNVATYTRLYDGKDAIQRDNDVVPILDKFIEEHLDFSFRGAKGIIALTGYEGILGYRTDRLDSSSYEEDKEKAMKVVNRLKATGWIFASHGYGHLDARKKSLSIIKRDTKRWKREVMPLIGETNVYIFPFGSSVYPGDKRFEYLLDEGFNIFCGVQAKPYLKYTDTSIIMGRLNVDGYTLNYAPKRLEDFFDPYDVIDKRRPPFD